MTTSSYCKAASDFTFSRSFCHLWYIYNVYLHNKFEKKQKQIVCKKTTMTNSIKCTDVRAYTTTLAVKYAPTEIYQHSLQTACVLHLIIWISLSWNSTVNWMLETESVSSNLWQTQDEISIGSKATTWTPVNFLTILCFMTCLLDTDKPSFALHAACTCNTCPRPVSASAMLTLP